MSIGCLQRAELIVGLDRARTQDMRAAIRVLDGPRIPTHAIVRPTGSLDCHPPRGRGDNSLPNAQCLPMDAMPLPNSRQPGAATGMREL